MRAEQRITDILIIGSGGTGLLGALHAKAGNPDLRVTIAVKGLLGKSGCSAWYRAATTSRWPLVTPPNATSWIRSMAANG